MVELKQNLSTPLGSALVVWIVTQSGKETKIGILLDHDDSRVYMIIESKLLSCTPMPSEIVEGFQKEV